MRNLLRVGTNYIPVQDVQRSANWYKKYLCAEVGYIDLNKAIVNLANQSFFLVKAQVNATANFVDAEGNERFSLTFEVDGLDALNELHKVFKEEEINVGHIENRGHAGRNFVFSDPDGNKFDVWSELSPSFKEKYNN